jgi:hypothetical protein
VLLRSQHPAGRREIAEIVRRNDAYGFLCDGRFRR